MKIRNYLLLAVLSMVVTIASAADQIAGAPLVNQVAEIAVLKAQLDTTRQMQGSFLSMAQWTLGSAIAVALALAGFGWYTNKTNYERDREAIQAESKSIRDALDIAVREGLLKSSDSLEKTLVARQVAIQQAVETTIQGKIEALSSRIRDVKDEVLGIKANAIEKEADEAVNKKSFGYAVYLYGQLLEIYVQRKTDEYEAADILDKLFKIVRIPGLSLDADAVNTAVVTLQNLPKNHHAACEPLIAALKACLR